MVNQMKPHKYLVLSDIHGNLSALKAVLDSVKELELEGLLLLGDQIDYGMRSNEVLGLLQTLPYSVPVKIWGNHEYAILMEDFRRFSSIRGQECAKYTASKLCEDSKAWLNTFSREPQEFFVGGKRCLAIHGSLKDIYWKSIEPDKAEEDYKAYDVVLSGHSHRPYCYTKYYQGGPPELRGEIPVIFINPGSVGQPRNGNPLAQFGVVDFSTMEVQLRAVPYDIEFEQSLFTENVSPFYRERLSKGV